MKENLCGKEKRLTLLCALAAYILFAGISVSAMVIAAMREDGFALLWMGIIFGAGTLAVAFTVFFTGYIFLRVQRPMLSSFGKILEILPENEKNAALMLADKEDGARLAAMTEEFLLLKQRQSEGLKALNDVLLCQMRMSRDIFFRICGEKQSVMAGPYWEKAYGFSPEGRRLEDLMYLETRMEFSRAVLALKNGKKAIDLTGMLSPGGAGLIRVRISASAATTDSGTDITGVIHDIENVYQLRASLSEEKKKSEFILESAEDIIYETDLTENRLKVINSGRAEELFGMGALEDFENGRKAYWDKIHPDYREGFVDRFYRYDHLVMLPGRRLTYEYRIRSTKGDYIWVEHTAWVIRLEKSQVIRVIGRIRDINGKKHTDYRQRRQDDYDGLTGALMKGALGLQFMEYIAKEPKKRRALVVFDINGFKHINRQYGFEAGDAVLNHLVRTLWRKQRKQCLVGKNDADTFIVAMLDPEEDPADHDSPLSMMKGVIECYDEPVRLNGHMITITVNSGCAFYPDDGTDYETLYRRARAAMMERRKQYGVFTSGEMFWKPGMGEALPD